jgi:hypothetical protein
MAPTVDSSQGKRDLGAKASRRAQTAEPLARPAPSQFRAPKGTAGTSTRLKHMQIIGSRFCLVIAGVTLAAGSAFAQATSSAPKESAPGANSSAPAQSLSKELRQSNGVIHPKEVDPGIQKPAPDTGDPNVVPPAWDFRGRSRAAAKISGASSDWLV